LRCTPGLGEIWHRDHQITEADPNAVRDDLLGLFGGWSERLLDLLRASDPGRRQT
jgi:hypothetical protein